MASTLAEEQARQAASVILPIEGQDYAEYDPEEDLWHIGVNNGVREVVVHPDGKLRLESTISEVLDDTDDILRQAKAAGMTGDDEDKGVPVRIYMTVPKV